MIVSLPMYDRAETAAANDRLWALIRAGLDDAPADLTRGTNPWGDWRSDDLLLSQTCGLPFRMTLHKRLHLVGSPDHRLADCAPGYYRSALVVQADDPRQSLLQFNGAALAYNSTDSQSGWAAPMAHCAKLGMTFEPGPETGGHRNSARAVAEGRADIAALDAVTWAQIVRWDEFANSLRVLDWTDPTPALPFVTAHPDLVDPLNAALAAGIAALSPDDRETLSLYGVVRIPAQAYLALPLPTGL